MWNYVYKYYYNYKHVEQKHLNGFDIMNMAKILIWFGHAFMASFRNQSHISDCPNKSTEFQQKIIFVITPNIHLSERKM